MAFDFPNATRRIFVPVLWMTASPVEAWQSHHEYTSFLSQAKELA